VIEHERTYITDTQFWDFSPGDVIIIKGVEHDHWYMKLATNDRCHIYDCVVNAHGKIQHFSTMEGFRIS